MVSTSPPNQSADHAWTRDEIRSLNHLNLAATPQAILDQTTSRLNKCVSLSEVEEITGRTRRQACGEFSGFTKLIRRELNREKWPFKDEKNSDGFVMYYCDSPEIAAWWQGS